MSPRHAALLLASALVLAPIAAHAALDTPTVSVQEIGHGKIAVSVTAGPSGCPNGFSLYWMTQPDYDDYGDVWPDQLSYPTLHWAQFTGVPTLNDGDGAYTTFQLAPNQNIVVEIGDLFDETGVTTNDENELEYTEDDGVDYVTCAFSSSGPAGARSGYSVNLYGHTKKPVDCTFTQGYWKTHPNDWGSVTSLTLGTVSYTKAQLLQILGQSVKGNGLVSLAHQLIATKLNILVKGADPTSIQSVIAAADAQIGSKVVPPIGNGSLTPSSVSHKTQQLDDYNNGCPGQVHCLPPTSTEGTTWGRIKTLYR